MLILAQGFSYQYGPNVILSSDSEQWHYAPFLIKRQSLKSADKNVFLLLSHKQVQQLQIQVVKLH